MSNLKNWSKGFFFWGGVILIVAFVLRIIPVFNESLAADEPFHLKAISQSWGQILHIVKNDMVTPPFSYLVLKAWSLALGQSLVVLRLFSLTCGMTVVFLTLVFGRMIFQDERVALLAGSLVAVNDLQVLASHYLRHYAMYTLLVLMLLIALWRALQKKRDIKAWIVFTVISIFLVYTHYIGWLFILSTLIIALSHERARYFWPWLRSVAVTFLCFLPWIIIEIPIYRVKGLDVNLGWVKAPSLTNFLEFFSRLNSYLFWKIGFLFSAAVAFTLIFAASIKLFSVPFSPSREQHRKAALLLIGPVLFTPFLLFLISIPPLDFPFWGYRHLIPAQAFFALLISFGIIWFSRNSRVMAALCISFLLILQLIPTLDNVLRYRLEPYNKVYVYLHKQIHSEDAIFTIPGYARFINYYVKSPPIARPLHKEKPVSELPASFWLVYRPANAEDSSWIKHLTDAGYSIQASQNFSKRKSDPRGLKIIFLCRQNSEKTKN